MKDQHTSDVITGLSELISECLNAYSLSLLNASDHDDMQGFIDKRRDRVSEIRRLRAEFENVVHGLDADHFSKVADIAAVNRAAQDDAYVCGRNDERKSMEAKEASEWAWCVFWHADGLNVELFKEAGDAIAFKDRVNTMSAKSKAYVSTRPIRDKVPHKTTLVGAFL